ncbi:MAG: phosphate acyltransferase, partial [Mariprofundaceae bacterium]|nr:phosphate acyltransferase [Mariprofundaceae bacterium]
RVKARINPSEYNGAPLLGLNGIVVKSHGSADTLGFARAIEIAHREVESELGSRIVESMNQWLEN